MMTANETAAMPSETEMWIGRSLRRSDEKGMTMMKTAATQ
jgi:hypothetical protein